jgi:hypothetical protein
VNGIAKSLAQLIAALPLSDETQAALVFLKRPGLSQIVPSGDESNYIPANHWLRTFRLKHASTARAGVRTCGFPSLLTALEKLPPSEPLTIAGFDGNGWHGGFWLNQRNQLIGFVLVAKRTPDEEQERLDWFHRDLT